MQQDNAAQGYDDTASCSDSACYDVSVVIPAFNAGVSIARAIDSVLEQRRPVFEVIVVDDGSTDNTADVVKGYGGKVHYIGQDNAGAGAARNRAIQQAKGNWIALLDADDCWLKKKMELQIEVLKSRPELQWCGANSYNVNGTEKSERSSTKKALKALGGKNYFDNYFATIGSGQIRDATVTMLIRKTVFEEVGLFSTELLRAQDTDIFCRIAFRYPEFGYVAEPLALMYLDVPNRVLSQRRLEAKRGVWLRSMIEQHLPMAEKSGSMQQYRLYARRKLNNSLLETLFHGHKNDARETVTKFRDFFGIHVRIAVYILTTFPRLTSAMAHLAAYCGRLLGFEKCVTRRWSQKKLQKHTRAK